MLPPECATEGGELPPCAQISLQVLAGESPAMVETGKPCSIYPVLEVIPVSKRYVNPERESKSAVRSIKRILLRRNSPIMERSNLRREGEDIRRLEESGSAGPPFPGVGVVECRDSICRNWGGLTPSPRPGPGIWQMVQSSRSITREGKTEAMWREKSDEAIVPMTAETTQLRTGKGLCFGHAWNGGKCHECGS
jgi:hypothetical protein